MFSLDNLKKILLYTFRNNLKEAREKCPNISESATVQ